MVLLCRHQAVPNSPSVEVPLEVRERERPAEPPEFHQDHSRKILPLWRGGLWLPAQRLTRADASVFPHSCESLPHSGPADAPRENFRRCQSLFGAHPGQQAPGLAEVVPGRRSACRFAALVPRTRALSRNLAASNTHLPVSTALSKK